MWTSSVWHPSEVEALVTASDTFTSQLVGVKGTPQHRSPSHEIRTLSCCLNCLVPQGAPTHSECGWATTSPLPLCTQLTRLEPDAPDVSGSGRLRPLRGRNCSASRKAHTALVRRTSRATGCLTPATSVWTAAVPAETSQQSHSSSAKANSSTYAARLQHIVEVRGL